MSRKGWRAVLWDMDGVIADTAEMHFRSWQAALARRGHDVSEAYFRESFGRRNDAIIRGLLGPETTDAVIREIAEDKENAYREIAAREVRLAPGVAALLQGLAAHGYRQALASSAPRANIDLVSRELRIRHYFAVVVDGSEVSAGKPDPEVFSLAAQRLGVAPRDALVVEDAVYGVQAATRAGMRVIAVTTSHPRADLAQADLVVDSLTEVTPDAIGELLNSARPKYLT